MAEVMNKENFNENLGYNAFRLFWAHIYLSPFLYWAINNNNDMQ